MTDPTDTHAAASAASRVLDMMAGAWLSQAIYVAAKLGIADLLESGPLSAEALAAQSGADADVLRRILLLLCSRGIFARGDDGRFKGNAWSDSLRDEAQVPLKSFAILLGEEPYWSAFGQLLQTAKTGNAAFQIVHGAGLYAYLEAHPDTAATFDAAITGRARQENAAVVDSYQWPPGLIVDVGGGQGTLLAAILARQPGATGILFDVPSVTEKAAKTLSAAGMAARATTVAGDFFASVPAGGDLYVLRRVLHGWRDDDAVRILAQCRAAMKPEGRLLVIEYLLDPDNRPTWGQMLDLQMLVLNPGGRERCWEEFQKVLARAGFQIARNWETGTVASLIEAIPAPPAGDYRGQSDAPAAAVSPA